MEHFKKHEFVMGEENVLHIMNDGILKHLDSIREIARCPLNITSSFRTKEYCEAHNIAYKASSQHNFGKAVDIEKTFNGDTLRAITYYCLEQGLSIGIAKSFIHIDCRETPTMWSY